MARVVRKADIAWAAGVIETQGKIDTPDNDQRATPQLRLRVQTGKIALANELGRLTGTEVRRTNSRDITVDRRACSYHCDEPHIHVAAHMPAMALWTITGSGAAIILSNCMAYFRQPDGLQAVIDNITQSLPKPGMRGYRAVEDSTLRLKRLGWHIPDGLWHRPQLRVVFGPGKGADEQAVPTEADTALSAVS